MKKLMLATTALVLAVGTASAADLSALPVKAKPRILLTYQGCGNFFGLGTYGETDRANVVGLNGEAVSAYTAGGAVYGTVGYMCGNGTMWWGVEAMFGYQNIGSSSGLNADATGSISSKIGFTQRAMLGGPISNYLALLPNLNTVFPALPAFPVSFNVVGTSHPYLFAALHEDDVSASYLLASNKVWQIRAGVGAGVKQQLGTAGNAPGASTVVANVWAEYLIPGAGMTIGSPAGPLASANQGGGARVGLALEY